MRRLLLAALAPALLIPFVLGVWSLATGRAPRTLWSRPLVAPLPASEPTIDLPIASAASRARGYYQLHVDPRVGYVLRPSLQFTMVGAPVTSDDLGLRMRTGARPAAAARTFAVVGDSVAFGQGVADGECLAQQVEELLAAARGDRAAPSWIGRTIAMPAWNWRNSTCLLLDHWDRLAPSVVLFVPIDNDLSDSEGVAERGRRRLVPDLMSDDPWLSISINRVQDRLIPLAARVAAGEIAVGDREVGPIALNADLGGESTRRYDAMADGLVAWAAELERRGARVAVAPLVDSSFTAILMERLLARRPDLATIPLLRKTEKRDLLADDPHPNAATVAKLARWVARSLVDELHWIDAAAPLPAPDPAFDARRAPRRAREEWALLADEARAAAAAALRERIEPAQGDGVNQVLGGLSPSGWMGPRLLAALPRRAGAIEVALRPIAGRADLLPLRVTVAIDGVETGALLLPAGSAAVVSARFALPPARDDDRASRIVEVKLVADRSAAVAEPEGYDFVSCVVERIAVAAD